MLHPHTSAQSRRFNIMLMIELAALCLHMMHCWFNQQGFTGWEYLGRQLEASPNDSGSSVHCDKHTRAA